MEQKLAEQEKETTQFNQFIDGVMKKIPAITNTANLLGGFAMEIAQGLLDHDGTLNDENEDEDDDE